MRLPGVRGPLSSVTRSTCLPPRCSWFWPETLVANAVPRVVAPCDRRTGPRQSRGPPLDGVVWWPRQTGSATLPVGRLQIGPQEDARLGGPGSVQGLPERVRLYLTSLAVTDPGKANRCCRTSGAVDDLLQGCSLLVVPSVVSSGVPDLIGTLSLAPAQTCWRFDQRHVSVTLHGRSVAGCLAEWRIWVARPPANPLQKENWASMASGSRRGLGGRRWLRYAGIAVLAGQGHGRSAP